jgi:hypothetical protein
MFLAQTTDDFTADARISHAWRFGRIALTAQVEVGGAMLHQTFATSGLAPPRMIGAALFGGGASFTVALGHGWVASLATELDTFVMRRDDGMTRRWDSTLSLGGVLAVGMAL